MLRNIWVESTLFSGHGDVKDDEEDLLWWLQALCARDQDYLKYRPETPTLYKSGVVWEAPKQFDGDCEEVMILKRALGAAAKQSDVRKVLSKIQGVLGGEHFCDIGVILELGAIDCFPMSQKIIVRSKSTGMYELVSIGEMRFAYQAYEALSYNFSTGKQEFKSILGFVDKGIKKVSKAHLTNGTDLIATDSHKFWALAGSRQCAPYPDSFRLSERTMGDYVRDHAERGQHSRAWWECRARILQAARIPLLKITKPTANEAYIAGIYAAEGFRTKHTLGIAQHKPVIRRKIEEALIGLGVQFSYDEARGATPGSGAQYRLLGGAKNEVVTRLREMGVDSFDKRFPQSYLSADADSVRKMLDAHADGDGWRPRSDTHYKKAGTRSMAVEHSTSSDALMEQIRLGLLLLGSPTYTYHQLDHQGVGNEPIWRVTEYNELASKLRGREERLTKLGLNDLTYATVRSAVPFGTAHVGCIEVEGNHNFFLADGTLVANCDGLACWRAAELRQAGIPARPMMTKRKRPDGGTTYHALVVWPPFGSTPHESSEDPSLLLGMGGTDRAADRAEEIRKNEDRCKDIRTMGASVLQPTGMNVDNAIESVLGMRRRPDADAAVAEVEKLLRGVG